MGRNDRTQREGGVTFNEQRVAAFWNTSGHWQLVTEGSDAKCPECGYPERHRIWDASEDQPRLIADGCPSCESSRMAADG